MEETKRQKQVAALLNEELNDIFRRLGLNVIQNGMISIASVKVTPDLLEVRIYLSFFKIEDTQAMLKKVIDRSWEIKRELAARVGKQLRRMPELQFFIDDTLDYVFKMEEIFNTIHKNDAGKANSAEPAADENATP
ncbi:MAG TPA: 30S ribosome-binding factor RbfA [Phnomibacter sp.]|nr:30S ribosome-binding factor RbfA [Phnomibacter sp.]